MIWLQFFTTTRSIFGCIASNDEVIVSNELERISNWQWTNSRNCRSTDRCQSCHSSTRFPERVSAHNETKHNSLCCSYVRVAAITTPVSHVRESLQSPYTFFHLTSLLRYNSNILWLPAGCVCLKLSAIQWKWWECISLHCDIRVPQLEECLVSYCSLFVLLK
jgi:hypothetical protein